MRIEWDPTKATANLETHGVSFSEAATALEDDWALTREDDRAEGERRFVTLGMTGLGNLLVVVFTHRGPNRVRLISAWKANRRQRVTYEESRS